MTTVFLNVSQSPLFPSINTMYLNQHSWGGVPVKVKKKRGTPKIIIITVLKVEQFGFVMLLCINVSKRMQTEWQTV